MESNNYQFDAFISYRRSESSFIGKWLRDYLIHYKLPKGILSGKSGHLKIYLDTSYERGTIDFYEGNIKPALQVSRYLIFIVTPSTKILNAEGALNWSLKELTDFQQFPQHENLILVLANGEYADVPGIIFQIYPNIEIIDLRGYQGNGIAALFKRNFHESEVLKIVAPLFNVCIDDMPLLRREEYKRKRKRRLTYSTIFIILFAAIFFYVSNIIDSNEKVKQKALTTFQRNAVNLVIANSDLRDIAGNTDAANSLLGNTCPILDTLVTIANNDSLFYGCAICHAYVSDIEYENYDFRNAMKEVEYSITMLQKALTWQKDKKEYENDLSNMYYRKAMILKQLSKYDSAIFYVQQAIDIVNNLAIQETKNNATYIYGQSLFQNFLASVYNKEGDYQKADSLYNKSIIYAQEAFDKRPSNEISYSRNLSYCIFSMVDIHKRKHTYKEIPPYINKAIQLSKNIYNKYNLNKRALLLMASTYKSAASAYEDMGDMKQAKKYCDSSSIIYGYLLNIDPNSRDALTDAARLTRIYSRVLFKLGDRKNGLSESEKEIALRKRIIDNYISTPDEQISLAETYQIHASNLAATGDLNAANNLFRKAIDLYKKPLQDSINKNDRLFSFLKIKLAYATSLFAAKDVNSFKTQLSSIKPLFDTLLNSKKYKANLELIDLKKTYDLMSQSNFSLKNKEAESLTDAGFELLGLKNNPKAAIEKFSKATAIRVNYTRAYVGLCWAYADITEFDKAIAYGKKALETDSTNASAYLNLGYAYIYSKDTVKALKHWAKCLKVPDDGNSHLLAYKNIGHYYRDVNNFNEACRYYIQALMINKNDINALKGLSYSLERLGEYQQALPIAQAICGIEPKKAFSYYNIGIVFENLQLKDSAKFYYEKSLLIDSNYSDARTGLNRLEKK